MNYSLLLFRSGLLLLFFFFFFVKEIIGFGN